MSKLVRFGVSLSEDILNKYDSVIEQQNYPTRSKAIEDLINQSITNWKLSDDKTIVVGSIDILYDHHKRELLNKLTDIQHDFQSIILSSHHMHLDHNNCFEIVMVKGQKKQVEKLASLIKSEKGVKHSTLRVVTV